MTQAKKIDDAKPAGALPPLSNIIFQALATRQAGFSQTAGKARRFLPEIGPLAGFSEPPDPDFVSGHQKTQFFGHRPRASCWAGAA
jgi:hypothetical protein